MSERLYKKLFEPISIGNMRLKNRIVMPAMTTNYAHRDGSLSQGIINYYAARTQGGAGLIIVEPACVDYPRGKGLVNQLSISGDESIGGLSALAVAIKSGGAGAALQLHHAGGLRLLAEPIPIAPIAPSMVRYRGYDAPIEAGISQIHQLIDYFVSAAERAKESGFDAIEFHGAHGYGIAQFLSPLNNRRSDEYGGSLEGRMRFFCEIVSSSRKRLGADYPIICRIDAEEFVDGGISIDESCSVAAGLEASGANAIHVSVNTTPVVSSKEIVSNVPAISSPPGTWINLAAQIKASCKIPVIAVGKIHSSDLAEQTLESGKADLIAVGRQLIADPQWPEKVEQGRLDEIRPCICCNCCLREVTRRKFPMVCAVNPEAGREGFKKAGTEKSKRTLIIGSGPAGMQAAITAAERGHDVEVWESGNDSGGQLRIAAIPPGKELLSKLADYMKHETVRLNVPIRYERHWTHDDVEQFDPDTIILATGSRDGLIDIPGIESEIMKTARDVLLQKAEIGKRVLIVGGGAVGCEVADFLSTSDKKITLIEQTSRLAEEMDPVRCRILLARLREASVRLLLNVSLIAIRPEGAMVIRLDGKTEAIEVDTVVLATAPKPNREILKKVENLAPEVFVIGDAMRPRKILDAITEGWMVGQRI